MSVQEAREHNKEEGKSVVREDFINRKKRENRER